MANHGYFMPLTRTLVRPRFGLLLWALSCLCLTEISMAAEREPVRFAYLEFPPFSYTDSQGRAHGDIIGIIRQLLQQAGYPAEFRSLPGARLYNGLVDGSVQMSAGAPGVPQLQGHILEGRHQLSTVDINLYHRTDTAPPALPEGLRGKRLLLINGYAYRQPISDWLTDPSLDIQISRSSSHQAALAMLMRRRGDFLIDYSKPIEQALQDADLPELPYITLRHLPITLQISKAMPGAEQLRDDLDRAYEHLQLDAPPATPPAVEPQAAN